MKTNEQMSAKIFNMTTIRTITYSALSINRINIQTNSMGMKFKNPKRRIVNRRMQQNGKGCYFKAIFANIVFSVSKRWEDER